MVKIRNQYEENEQIVELEKKINSLERLLKTERHRLKEAIGAWRRKIEGRGLRKDSIREGFNSERGTHYKVLEDLYPFTFRKVDFSRRYKGWLMEVERTLNKQMQLETDFLMKYYSQN
ncbi:hypothetical protein MKY80_18720 [Lysinibacillus sp. FSL R5-0849]|uniref:hypothetical protein n=1 Tax=Lysinibacillus sp. FSL R5-0849 TaxID=2921660 RepID=UPI00315A051B